MSFETRLAQDHIDRFTSQGLWTDKLITDHLRETAAAAPDRTASVDSRGSSTYGELARLVDRVAFGFLELGVRPGSVISIQLPNWREWLLAHFAAVRIGAVTNPLIPIYRDREVGYMMQQAGSELLVTTQEFRKFDYTQMVDRLRPDLPALRHVLVVAGSGTGGTLRDGFASWEEFIGTPWEEGRDAAELDALRPNPNDVSLLMFTSGTTGRPKGVLHSHNTVGAASVPWPDRLGMDSTAVVHMASTFAHLTGYLFGVQLPIQLGGTGVFQDVWKGERFVELVQEHGITHTSGATPFLHDLLEASNLAEHDVSSLAHFCCMGAPIPRVMVRRAKERIPATSVFGGWGQTECGLSTMGHPADPEDKIINSDGRALLGMSVRVTDFDGEEQPPDTEGKLWVKGPFLFLGYLNQLEATREQFDGEWFDTGDLATIDAEGYLRIAGRSKDVIIRGGENIPVSYVENVLYEHPAIQTVALVAIPHERLQEIAAAAVVLHPGHDDFDLAEMSAFLEAKGVSKSYWPERLEVLEQLPQTPSGKIQKFQLRELFAGTAAAPAPAPAPATAAAPAGETPA